MRKLLTRAAKGLYWTVLPWPVRERVKVLRQNLASRKTSSRLARWVQRERERSALRMRGLPAPAPAPLDLFDDEAVALAAGLPAHQILWPPAPLEDVSDLWSASRFLIELWRRREDLRNRFPDALSAGSAGGFGNWLRKGGASELGLSSGATAHALAALDARLGARARQAFLANIRLAAVLPHGLTPAGHTELFCWFMQWGKDEAALRLEEIWWLFLEAAQQAPHELLLAHSFAPEWQKQHPEGLTIFGRRSFAAWFAAEYGTAGSWTDPHRWPKWHDETTQVRIGYWARPQWRRAYPMALSDQQQARAFLRWLASADAGLEADQREWCAALDADAISLMLTKPGVNVIGHFCYPSGLRVSVESMTQAMRSAGVSTSLRDVLTDPKDDPQHAEFHGVECFDTTIIHVQPEPHFDAAYERAQLEAREPRTYRIAYWYWEFASIPDSWVAKAKNADEVWAATNFVAQGLKDRLKIPVRTLFPGVKLAPFQRRGRDYFGLDNGPFTFLFTFHMMSVMERKNPLGLIRAFKLAFAANDGPCLVLKTSYGERYPAQLQELREAAEGANIKVIDAVYSPADVLALMDVCDSYVSLHRSEGLGLTIAEAMLLGKPVIATNFSGNVDFMDESNSLPVDYKLVKLGWPIPPYDAHLEWAEPSIKHAAQQMRRVNDNQEWAREVGQKGKASAEANLSLEAAGQRFSKCLEEIRATRTVVS
ncbi:glycosyltransferase family 4 protein [Variovorax sp. J22R133]|uniref:glycosyltransferase family 4 protein n=1 Tax=Variovorax brevis TaxID=3053503 RepID=UPI0025773209|nr:glycosyltransferase family 4 protein [Variovorax sp. J22R133]MDM0114684.1 glycosyltransferase family 4 protein [Variovorax sp. J22R133]